ncbi:methyltransferase domain-containing protein [Streptomyces qinzhouensis]|uniref:Protein-L-isoaspartate O-methyltransferase n=1 Tax=Streptomyces qinzhouensis TaxID=2599401 RepID=A0A5B8J846_9ACTN|nr:methyltransferase domain-containing protein [Streptomyces qinzhouensis]QDY77497.1 methyltransferase domain-containing protein [Streptomyces qinzhouensis]
MSTPERLVGILTGKGAIPPGWEETVAAVRRELFLPDSFEADGRTVSRDREPERWLRCVYGDLALTTQVDDGRATPAGSYRLPTSSSSMPSIMLEMLSLLRAEEGHRVLEAGAGTGYNAAWLAHRLGGGNVVSVDIDPVLAGQAARNAAAAGTGPRIVCGDADRGWPQGAPYDRLIATYTVPRIPYTWIEQTPGGRIVAPWGGSFFHASFAVLDVADGVGRGSFHGRPSFMRTRNARPHRGRLRDFLHHTDEADEARTALDPHHLLRNADALFAVGLALPRAWYHYVLAGDGSGEATLWLLADDRASWASVDYVPGQRDYLVEQYGPERLWETAEGAFREWEGWGRPERDRFGITVSADAERVWLDHEERVVDLVR